MGSLSFVDPKSGKEIEFRRDSKNPFYAKIKSFRDSRPTTLCFMSDGMGKVARNAYVFPDNFPLVAVPAIRLQLTPVKPTGHLQVHGSLGYFNQSHKTGFPSRLPLNFQWVRDVWEQHLVHLLYDDLYCSYLNYLGKKSCLGEFDLDSDSSGPLTFVSRPKEGRRYYPGRSYPREEEFPHLVYLKICLGWPHWQEENISWLARTEEAVELGICRKMDEDNFRKICKKAGLLIPRSSHGKRVEQKAARKSK